MSTGTPPSVSSSAIGTITSSPSSSPSVKSSGASHGSIGPNATSPTSSAIGTLSTPRLSTSSPVVNTSSLTGTPHGPIGPTSTPPSLSSSAIGNLSSAPLPTSSPVVNTSSLTGMPHAIGPATPPNLSGSLGPLPPGAVPPFMPPLGPDSAFYPLPDNLEAWRSALPYASSMYYCPYDSGIPSYFPNGYGMDLNGARRKNATRETTSMLKQWLSEHRKNPYPTKGEKIMLAIITKMTLTQVSTWFANARRRLKKENKMTWSPRNRCEEDEQADADAEKDGRDTPSDRRSLDGTVSPSEFNPSSKNTSTGKVRIKSESGDDADSDIVDIEDDSSNLDIDTTSGNNLHRLASSHHNDNHGGLSHLHHHHIPHHLHSHHSLNHHHHSSSGNGNSSSGQHLNIKSEQSHHHPRRSGSPGSDVGSYSDSDTASQPGNLNGSVNNTSNSNNHHHNHHHHHHNNSGSGHVNHVNNSSSGGGGGGGGGSDANNILLGLSNGALISAFNTVASSGSTTTTSSSKPRIWSIADMAAGSKNLLATVNNCLPVSPNQHVSSNVSNASSGANDSSGGHNSPQLAAAVALNQQIVAAFHQRQPASFFAASQAAAAASLMSHHPGQMGHPGSGLPSHLSPLAAAAAAAAAATNHPSHHLMAAALAGSTPGSNLYHPSLHPSSLGRDTFSLIDHINKLERGRREEK